VSLWARFPVLFFTATLFLSAALAGLTLWVWSKAYRPFDYMVVGTLLAAVGLVVAFMVVVRRKQP
jgi:hypothetical protein